jgi:acetyl/propionyl-CoA carboxylase alpha subunit/acetyl-CoA carboxylase carboxyltransferase component
MKKQLSRIAIINRGEAAMRLIWAARELSAEGQKLTTIALYTEPDRQSMFVREADEAYCLGGAYVENPGGGGGERRHAYTHLETLERALEQVRADAAWPGWGFVAEQAAFAELCAKLGITFIGPDAAAMRKLGDKIAAKQLAEELGLPVAPWSGGPVENVDQLRAHARQLGYPLMIKATAGGGGRGIRAVAAESELAAAFSAAGVEAARLFGDGGLFVERLIEGARHVEVPVVADCDGAVWPLGVRDCTLQRRHQKLLEESPSPVLSREQEAELQAQAVKLVSAAKYCGAATVEFLYDRRDDAREPFSFMEVNARLQVEHPVTEARFGADVVKLQLHVAAGGKLEGTVPEPQGHAIEVRINAEDPEAGFAPSPGVLERFHFVGGPGVRIDAGFDEGDAVSSDYDSMLAKVVAHGRSRKEALGRLRRTLATGSAMMSRGGTTRGFVLDLLDRPEVLAAEVDVGWIDRLVKRGEHVSRQHAEVAVIKAAIDAFENELSEEREQFYAWAARGRPRIEGGLGHDVELSYRGHTYSFRVLCVGSGLYRIQIDGRSLLAELVQTGRDEQRLRIGEQSYRVRSVAQPHADLVEVDGVPHRIAGDTSDMVEAAAPAVVVSVAVKEGDTVQRGDKLAVLEAMKSEMAIIARHAGRVRQVFVLANQQVGHGEPLMQLEPLDSEQAASGERLRFEVASTEIDVQQKVRNLILGFDIDAKELKQGKSGELDELQREREDEVLRTFRDICALFSGSGARQSGPRSTRENFHRFLRDPDTVERGLPQNFINVLTRAVSHYGVRELVPSARLRRALFRIYKSRSRLREQVGSVLAILQRRLDRCEQAGKASDEFRQLLDDLVRYTQRGLPAVCDLAREVRYQYYDQPVLEQVGSEIYQQAERHLAGLLSSEGEVREHIDALVACPLPLHGLLADRFADAGEQARCEVLEVLTRRHYRIRELDDVSSTLLSAKQPVCRASYQHPDGRKVRLLSTWVCDQSTLDSALAALSGEVEAVAKDCDVVIDCYARRNSGDAEQPASAESIEQALKAAAFTRPVRRIVVGLSSPGATRVSHIDHFTFRPDEGGGFSEERVYRGLHPMVGKRMNLWRLSKFEISRLPSVPDIFLFLGVARENPKDQRLFVLAEVRDLTPVRDDKGRLIGVPYLERVVGEAVAALRRAQMQRAVRQRLHWNRIMLFVWPVLDLPQDEVKELVHRLAPSTSGLGLEKVTLATRIPGQDGTPKETVLEVSNPGQAGVLINFRDPPTHPMQPLAEYEQKVVRLRQRGLIYPYELIKRLTPSREIVDAALPPGEFIEYDVDENGTLAPVDRLPGLNSANIVVGLIRNFTPKYPEGMTRVALLGDPSRAMGSLAEPECRRIILALDLAEEMGIPLEWYALSAGAEISMKRGTENMDWISWVLRRLITYTQAGGEINVVVCGINVGAQPYWNAEATMLMHTRGVLIMTPDSAMVLTGKRALDYSGGVSAADNSGIGGYDTIMGPNGQAQYFGRDLAEACQILLRYYDHTYVVAGERFPRRAATKDPAERDVCSFPHAESQASFATVGDVFDSKTNPGRKQPFDIRSVMRACADQDHEPLERWYGMMDAEVAVVWEAHIGGYPVSLLGIESKPLSRQGFVAADGPSYWTPGTLFPIASKKVARAVNAATGNRPLVILANLSGFDGSPESMRNLQLEYGAEIGRAVVNFEGPIVFCVVSRYHGGAFVVFSNKLNENMEVAALEGTYASVIGGAPAAAVVFAREVKKRTVSDARLTELQDELARAEGAKKAWLQVRYEQLSREVHSQKLGEVADEFDGIHSVQRARDVGSVHHIISPERLRPYLIEAIERGIQKELSRLEQAAQAADPVAIETARVDNWKIGSIKGIDKDAN